METRSEKTEKSLEYLERKRDTFTDIFLRTSYNILNAHPDQDIDSFCQTFLPSKTDIIQMLKKSRKNPTNSIRKNNPRLRAGGSASPTCLDSQLIEQLCRDWKIFEEDFGKLNNNIPLTSLDKTNQSKDSCHAIFSDPDYKVFECECKAKKIDQKPTESSTFETEFIPHETESTSHNISQIINAGEMTKIFINKSRIDVNRSMTNNPIFDEPIETIYVYRQKNRCD